MKQADINKIFFGLDSQITFIQSFSTKIEKEPCSGLKAMMPSQLNKYRHICYSIPTTTTEWNNIPNVLEALALIPLICKGQNKKVSDACEQSIQLIYDTNLEKKHKELLINGSQKDIKKNQSKQRVINQLKLLLFNIQVLRETNLDLQKNLSKDNYQNSIESKLRPIEVALNIKIVAKIILNNDKKLQYYYPKKQQSTEIPDIFIFINKLIGITQVQYIDYKNILNSKELDSQLVLFFENPERFCTSITKNILVLFFLKNLLNQIVWTAKKTDCTLRDITDSFIFDAAGEAIDSMKQEISMDIVSKLINQNQNVELRWDDFIQFKEQFVKQLMESIHFKKIEGAKVIADQRAVGYDCFVKSLPNMTISFKERESGINYQQLKISWISIEERADFICKLTTKLENVIVAFENNQPKQFPQQFQVYQILSRVKNGVIEIVQLSVLSYLLLCSQNQDYEYLKQQFERKANNQSTQKEIEFLKQLFQAIKRMMEFSSLKKRSLINNPVDIGMIAQFILELMVEKYPDLFDPTISEDAQSEKITTYLNEIGVKVVVVKSNDRDDQLEDMKQAYLSSGVDILVDLSQTPARVYIQMLRESSNYEEEEQKASQQLERYDEEQMGNSQTNNLAYKNGDKLVQRGINQEKQQIYSLYKYTSQNGVGTIKAALKKDEGQSTQLRAQSAKSPQTVPHNKRKPTENFSLQNNQSSSNNQIQSEKQIIEKPQTRKQPPQQEMRPQAANPRQNFSQQDYHQLLDNSDLPQQLSLHSDLFYLVNDWEQVLALFYLFNIKDQILLRDNTEEEDSCQNISTSQLIGSILFLSILDKCRKQGIKETHKLQWNLTYQDNSNQMTSQLLYEFKLNKNVMNQQADQQGNCRDYPVQITQYDAEIQFPRDGKYKYIVEFTPNKNNRSNSDNKNPQKNISLCKECKLRAITVLMQQMCRYCFVKKIQDYF